MNYSINLNVRTGHKVFGGGGRGMWKLRGGSTGL